MHMCIGVFSNKIQKYLYCLHSITEHFAPLLCECTAKHVSISLDVSYQWSKATALNFSQELSYLTTALSLCLFSSEVRYQDIVATAKKGQSLQRQHAAFITSFKTLNIWLVQSCEVGNPSVQYLKSTLLKKHTDYRGICTLQSVSRWDRTLGSLGIKVRSHS